MRERTRFDSDTLSLYFYGSRLIALKSALFSSETQLAVAFTVGLAGVQF